MRFSFHKRGRWIATTTVYSNGRNPAVKNGGLRLSTVRAGRTKRLRFLGRLDLGRLCKRRRCLTSLYSGPPFPRGIGDRLAPSGAQLAFVPNWLSCWNLSKNSLGAVTPFRLKLGGRPRRLTEPCRASIALASRSRSAISKATICSVSITRIVTFSDGYVQWKTCVGR